MRPRAAFLALLLVAVLHAGAPRSLGGTSLSPLVVGYYVDDDPHALATLADQSEVLSQIITTNYELLDNAGTLRGSPDREPVNRAHAGGLRVEFRVANVVAGEFRPEIARAVLSAPEARARLLVQILGALDEKGADGVNVDLEGLTTADRAAFTAFIDELSEVLAPRGKTLSVAVPGATEDRGAFDLAALGRRVDFVIIMAYDEHWSGSAPGPVASLPWVEAVARYSVTRIAPEKILLGVPFYGYDWPAPGVGEGISSREALVRAVRAGAEISWDDQARAPYYQVGSRVVYFENARSTQEKLAVAQRWGLAGVSAWRLGQELPETWAVVRSYAGAVTTLRTASPVPASR